MMNSMIKENGVTFKELEKNIYAWVCQIGREFTKEFLERYDRMLMEDRDKKKYRNKEMCIRDSMGTLRPSGSVRNDRRTGRSGHVCRLLCNRSCNQLCDGLCDNKSYD